MVEAKNHSETSVVEHDSKRLKETSKRIVKSYGGVTMILQFLEPI